MAVRQNFPYRLMAACRTWLETVSSSSASARVWRMRAPRRPPRTSGRYSRRGRVPETAGAGACAGPVHVAEAPGVRLPSACRAACSSSKLRRGSPRTGHKTQRLPHRRARRQAQLQIPIPPYDPLACRLPSSQRISLRTSVRICGSTRRSLRPASACSRRCRYLHHPLRLLRLRATVAGRHSHPLKNGALWRDRSGQARQ